MAYSHPNANRHALADVDAITDRYANNVSINYGYTDAFASKYWDYFFVINTVSVPVTHADTDAFSDFVTGSFTEQYEEQHNVSDTNAVADEIDVWHSIAINDTFRHADTDADD